MRFVGDTYVADSTQYIYTTHIPLYLLVQSVKIQTETNMIFPFFMLVKTIREYWKDAWYFGSCSSSHNEHRAPYQVLCISAAATSNAPPFLDTDNAHVVSMFVARHDRLTVDLMSMYSAVGVLVMENKPRHDLREQSGHLSSPVALEISVILLAQVVA